MLGLGKAYNETKECVMLAWIALFVLFGIYSWAVRSKLTSLTHQIAQEEVGILSVLKEQFSLVGDLPGFVTRASADLNEILSLRNSAGSGNMLQMLDKEKRIQTAMGNLNAQGLFKTKDPDYLALMDQLEQNRRNLKKAIESYNDLVKEYDGTITTFPASLLARGFTYKPLISSGESSKN